MTSRNKPQENISISPAREGKQELQTEKDISQEAFFNKIKYYYLDDDPANKAQPCETIRAYQELTGFGDIQDTIFTGARKQESLTFQGRHISSTEQLIPQIVKLI